MNAWSRRAAALVLAGLLLLLLAAAWGYRALWQRYDQGLTQLQARSERLDGLLHVGPRITQDLAAARATVSPWLHPAGDNAANDVQQRLRELISASGNTLVSAQAALEPAAEGQLARVQLGATITGEWAGLVRFMQALQQQTPPFWVQAATLTRDGPATAGAAQTARLVLQLRAPLAPPAAARDTP